MELQTPYLLFLGNAPDQLAPKTAQGIVDWRPDLSVGQARHAVCAADLGLREVNLKEAVNLGAKTMVIGVANAGGILPSEWTNAIVTALKLKAGLDVASGLHTRLDSVPEISAAASQHNCRLIDVRTPKGGLPVGSGKPRTGRRALMIGTDCSVGKMYATLAIEAEMKRRNMRGLPQQSLPGLKTCIETNLQAARLTCPQARCVGVAVNTSLVQSADAQAILDQIEAELGLPAQDPFTTGVERLVDALIAP